MSVDKEIKKGFKNLFPAHEQTFFAIVKEVDKDNKVIKIEDEDEFPFENVRLTSVIDDADKVVKYPKVNSTVLISRIGIDNDDEALYVSAFSEIESIEGIIDNTNFIINADGYEINSDGENLKEVLNDYIVEFGKLCDELSKVLVSIGTTPNVPVITQIKQKATVQIKQRLNKILK
jgi:hypothetical protein